jgi:hypothetical protein
MHQRLNHIDESRTEKYKVGDFDFLLDFEFEQNENEQGSLQSDGGEEPLRVTERGGR